MHLRFVILIAWSDLIHQQAPLYEPLAITKPAGRGYPPHGDGQRGLAGGVPPNAGRWRRVRHRDTPVQAEAGNPASSSDGQGRENSARGWL